MCAIFHRLYVIIPILILNLMEIKQIIDYISSS